MRHLVPSLAILIGCTALSIVGTILALPFWRWLENTYGFEAVGHSGPAEWCYVVTFLACVVAAAATKLWRGHR